MSNETDSALLISLIVLVAVIAWIVWWYWVRRKTAESARQGSFTPPGHKDPLTLINGIGKTLEAKLNELGITSFRQIAEFDDKDIEKVNAELQFKGRIQREGWVAQARKLVEAASRPQGAGRKGRAATRKKLWGPARKTARKKSASKKTTAGKSSGKKTGKKTRKKTKRSK